MTSFYPSPPPPPPPPPPRPPAPPTSTGSTSRCYVDRLHVVTKEGLSWLISRYKSVAHRKNLDVSHLVLGALAVSAAGFLTLPPHRRMVVVNFWGFSYASLATIGETGTTKKHAENSPSTFAGYWVRHCCHGLALCT